MQASQDYLLSCIVELYEHVATNHQIDVRKRGIAGDVVPSPQHLITNSSHYPALTVNR